MNELTTTAKNLPQTIEEKTAFVLFGSDALNAYRKKLKAIQSKYGISSEQYKQIQLEAQETAENLLLFSADIGKEMQKIKTAQGFASFIPDVDGKNAETKTQTIHSMGFTDRQARRRNPNSFTWAELKAINKVLRFTDGEWMMMMPEVS